MKPRVPRYRYGQHGLLASLRKDVLERAKQSGEKAVALQIEDFERLLDIADRAEAPGVKGRPPKHSVRYRKMIIEETQQRLKEIRTDQDEAEIINDVVDELGCTNKEVWEMLRHPGRIGNPKPRGKKRKKVASVGDP